MYGRTKLAGENFVKEFSDEHFIIRTAWLYGDGKNFVKTMLRLAETHDEVRVVRDQVGSPTSAAELAKMIAYLLPTDNYGLFHGTCEGVCSWADFAAEIFRLAGKKTHVEGITTAEYEAGHADSSAAPGLFYAGQLYAAADDRLQLRPVGGCHQRVHFSDVKTDDDLL